MPSSRVSSQLRDRTCISYVSFIGRFFITSTTWEACSMSCIEVIWCSLYFMDLFLPWVWEIFSHYYYYYFDHVLQLEGSQFPNQSLNLVHSSDHKPWPLDHQGTVSSDKLSAPFSLSSSVGLPILLMLSFPMESNGLLRISFYFL